MIGRISDYQAEQWLDVIRLSPWLGLHQDNPDIAGAYASEIFGGGYARQSINFSPVSSRAIWNINPCIFTGLTAVTITHLTIWDSQYNGNYLASMALSAPFRVVEGKTLTIGSGLVAVSLD